MGLTQKTTKNLSKEQIEKEILRIFNKRKPTLEDLRRSRVLTKQFIKETNFQIND